MSTLRAAENVFAQQVADLNKGLYDLAKKHKLINFNVTDIDRLYNQTYTIVNVDNDEMSTTMCLIKAWFPSLYWVVDRMGTFRGTDDLDLEIQTLMQKAGLKFKEPRESDSDVDAHVFESDTENTSDE